MSYLLRKEIAWLAVQYTFPAVQRLIETKVLKRSDLHIVVASPLIPENIKEDFWYEKGILYEYSIGDPEKWEFPFKKIARSKCYLSWRYQMPTQVIQARAPHLLGSDSTLYYGSAVSDGLVVACSGVQPYFDQMISSWVLEACRALCIQERESLGDGNGGFVS